MIPSIKRYRRSLKATLNQLSYFPKTQINSFPCGFSSNIFSNISEFVPKFAVPKCRTILPQKIHYHKTEYILWNLKGYKFSSYFASIYAFMMMGLKCLLRQLWQLVGFVEHGRRSPPNENIADGLWTQNSRLFCCWWCCVMRDTLGCKEEMGKMAAWFWVVLWSSRTDQNCQMCFDSCLLVLLWHDLSCDLALFWPDRCTKYDIIRVDLSFGW